jgi:carbonic anhydrase
MCEQCDIRSRSGLSRRGLLGAFSAALAVAAAGPAPQSTISGEEALRRMMDGNARYAANKTSARDFAAGR